MTTTLEERAEELRKFADEIDEKGSRATKADLQRLSEMTADVKAGHSAFEARRAAAGDATEGQKYLARVAAGQATEPGTEDASLGAPPITFDTDSLRELHKGAVDRRVTTKASISSTTAPMSAVGDYRLAAWPWLRDRARILDFIPVEPTQNPTVFYYRATAAASAAAAVAEGAAKPESTPTWESVEAPVRKLAHYTRVNDEVIADFDGFRNLIGREMIAGLIDQENAQLLNGNGTAPNLRGLLQTAGIQTVGSAGTDLDAIATAMNMIRVTAHLEPDIVVMHPNDWASTGFLLAKDSNGQYLLNDALTNLTPRLWGVRVVLTTAMTENTALVANLADAARVYLREAPVLEVAPFGGGTTEFIANQTLVRAEERLGLAVVRPTALCTVTAV